MLEGTLLNLVAWNLCTPVSRFSSSAKNTAYFQTPTYLLCCGLLPWDILPICSLVKFPSLLIRPTQIPLYSVWCPAAQGLSVICTN